MKKYRVLEHLGLFYIQIEVTKQTKTGMLWWKKTIETKGWERCSETGTEIFYSKYMRIYTSPSLSPLKTLRDAMDRISLFLKPDQVYEYGYTYENMNKPVTRA